MLEIVDAIEFVRLSSNGKTRPALIACERQDGEVVEVVAKFSAGPERGTNSLAIEVLCACLAHDLGLPIVEPLLVRWSPAWASIVPEPYRKHVLASSPIAFGSKLLTGQLTQWTPDLVLFDAMIDQAARIFAFDAWIDNIDRRSENPNCIVRGSDIRIFDHDLAFPAGPIIGKKPPWAIGALQHFTDPGRHIFRAGLRGKVIDYAALRASWQGLSDARLAVYGAALPPEWASAMPIVAQAIETVRNVRDNLDDCVEEMQRVLV